MSDLLALLDTLDGLHKAATPVTDGGSDDNGGYLVPTDNDVREYLWLCPGGAATKDDIALLVALRLAYPHLAQALRTTLTPTTDGEREARPCLSRSRSGARTGGENLRPPSRPSWPRTRGRFRTCCGRIMTCAPRPPTPRGSGRRLWRTCALGSTTCGR